MKTVKEIISIEQLSRKESKKISITLEVAATNDFLRSLVARETKTKSCFS
jgi:hypothetical protein